MRTKLVVIAVLSIILIVIVIQFGPALIFG